MLEESSADTSVLQKDGHVVPEKVWLETSLEAKIREPKLLYVGHILRRLGSLEKTVMLGQREGSRKRGRPNRRWIDHNRSPRRESPGAEHGCGGWDIVDGGTL